MRVKKNVILRGLAVVIVCAGMALAQGPITVVNAAGYQTTLAPDSLATIFGTNLAPTTATGTLDADGNLPVELASTRVEINGQSASLFYVSPTQINFVVPGGIGAGTSTILVRYTNSSLTRTASVTIAASSPALFSSDQTGTGPGAIRNAVTFAQAPFLVETAQSTTDPRTRLALYGTGFRHAKAVTARATTASGKGFDLTVEFFGAAPGFFGLDQINVLLPPDVDGAGAVSLTAAADTIASNTVTAQINLLPVSQLRLSGITLSPNYVTAGMAMTATVTLNGVARAGGFPISLRSSNPAAQPPGQATIPEGSASVQAQVATSSISNTQSGSIQASGNGATVSADFTVDAATQAQLTAVSVSPGTVLGGRSISGTVMLSAPAPAAGVSVVVVSDNSAVRPPTPVNVPVNQSSAAFTIPTQAVNAEVNATITATLGRNSVTAQVKLLPPMSFTVDTASVTGGSNITGTIRLGEAAPSAGAQISLSSSDATIVRTPPTLAIGSGLTSGTFVITTTAVTSPRTAVITATYQSFTLQLSITVNPPATPVLDSVSISPSTVAGGTSTQGTVTLTAAAGFAGQRIDLQSSSLLTASVPGFVTVPQGATSASFTITTTRVVSAQTVTITARMGNIAKTATMTVQ